MNNLATVFVQSAPFLKKLHPNHPLFNKHAVFSHPAYGAFARIQLEHVRRMEALEKSKVSDLNAVKLSFAVELSGDTFQVTPTQESARRCETINAYADQLAKTATQLLNPSEVISDGTTCLTMFS